MENKRELDRRQLHRYPHILDTDDELFGYLGNISYQGMLLIAYQPIEAEEQRQFSIQLPAHMPFHQPILPVSIEARWFKPYDESHDFYRIGCQFLNLPPIAEKLITEMQSLLGFAPGFNPGQIEE